MKPLRTFLPLFLLLTLSCKDELPDPAITEEQLHGKWAFSEVTRTSNSQVQHLTADYAGALLELKENHSARMTQGNETYSGSWTFFTTSNDYFDASDSTWRSETVYNLDIRMHSPNGAIKNFNGTRLDISSTGQSISFCVDEPGETYFYHFAKQ